MNAPWLVRKPDAPSVYDDEFESEVLDPKWVVTGGTFTETKPLDPYNTSAEAIYRYNTHHDRKSWLMCLPRGGSPTTSEGLEQAITYPTNCFVIARVSASLRKNTAADGDGEIFLRVYNDVGGMGLNSWLVGIDSFTGIRGGISIKVVASAQSNVGLIKNYLGEGLPLEYIGLQKLGATWHCWMGTASGNWVWMGSQTFASDNFDRVRLLMHNNAVTSPGRMIVGIDFFRVIEGKGPP